MTPEDVVYDRGMESWFPFRISNAKVEFGLKSRNSGGNPGDRTEISCRAHQITFDFMASIR